MSVVRHALSELLRRMGDTVADQLRRASLGLLTANAGAAQHAIALDEDVDAMELQVNEACARLLGEREAGAARLRFVAATMKAVTEFERIGDQAESIARAGLRGGIAPQLLDAGLRAMASLAQEMVADAVQAVARGDAALASKVVATRASLELLQQETARRLVGEAAADPDLLADVQRLGHVARAFARIGRHATKAAEMVPYMADAPRLPDAFATREQEPAWPI